MRTTMADMSERAADDSMSEGDRRDMNEYGITHHHKSVYTYKTHAYDRLSDALAYARIDSARTER